MEVGKQENLTEAWKKFKKSRQNTKEDYFLGITADWIRMLLGW